MGTCGSKHDDSFAGPLQERIKTLEQTPFGYRLTRKQLAAFARYFTLHTFEQGETIVDPARHADPTFWVVVAGSVQILVGETVVATKGVNSFFGQIGMEEASILEKKMTLMSLKDEAKGKGKGKGKGLDDSVLVGADDVEVSVESDSEAEEEEAAAVEANAARRRRAMKASKSDSKMATSIVRANRSTRCLRITRPALDEYFSKVDERLRETICITMGAALPKNLRSIEIFQNIPPRKLELLSNILHYVWLNEGDRLFEEGSTGQQLYIVFQGQCHAVARERSEEEDDDNKQPPGRIAENNDDSDLEEQRQKQPSGKGGKGGAQQRKQSTDGTAVAPEEEVILNTFHPGDFFGEISLMMDMPRTASIVAAEDSLLLELRKDDFQHFLKLTPNLYFNDLMKRRFANHFKKYKVPFFEAIPESKYPMLASLCQVHQFDPFTVLFREGDVGREFFIIAHGEVAVTVQKRESLALAARRPAAGSIIELSRMGPGQYFGEIALLRDTMRSATVTTLTRCVILSITKSNFEKFFESAPEALADFEVKLGRYDCVLRSVIYHPVGLKYFTKFLEKEYSEENIHFWVAARAYRHIGQVEPLPAPRQAARTVVRHSMFRSDSSPDSLLDMFRAQNKYEPPQPVPEEGAGADGEDGASVPEELRQQLLQEAQRIVQQFIAVGSPEQVNVNGDQRTVIEEAVTTGEVTLNTFAGAEREILALMERDSFARFKQSELFREFLGEAESYEDDRMPAPTNEPKMRSGSLIKVDEREVHRRETILRERAQEYAASAPQAISPLAVEEED